jgi:hypothetical protein
MRLQHAWPRLGGKHHHPGGFRYPAADRVGSCAKSQVGGGRLATAAGESEPPGGNATFSRAACRDALRTQDGASRPRDQFASLTQ